VCVCVCVGVCAWAAWRVRAVRTNSAYLGETDRPSDRQAGQGRFIWAVDSRVFYTLLSTAYMRLSDRHARQGACSADTCTKRNLNGKDALKLRSEKVVQVVSVELEPCRETCARRGPPV